MSDDAPRSITLAQFQELERQALEEEATWTQRIIFARQVAVMPCGHCHVYELNTTYDSLEDAIAAIRRDVLCEWTHSLTLYTKIIGEFDQGREYDEYFTERWVANHRQTIRLLPEWITRIEAGQFLVKCETPCEGAIGEWVEKLDFDHPPPCDRCGGTTKFC